jgi:hypothetical protein
MTAPAVLMTVRNDMEANTMTSLEQEHRCAPRARGGA